MINVLLVTTWGEACGIAEHSAMLKEAVEAADPTITITPDARALDPHSKMPYPAYKFDVLHLNYHAALHSRWTPKIISEAREGGEYKAVVVTYHDTGIPNTDQCKAVCAEADAVIIHEPAAEDLSCRGPIHYWRMGVPAWAPPYSFCGAPWLSWGRQPILGSIGFPFGWKNYDELARITAAVGWALLLIAPTATDEQIATWRALNPALHVERDFVSRTTAVQMLGGCDATAFTYVCHNAGQSGAILQGIAARKPVIALATCRQFRALFADKLGRVTINWIESFEDLALHLQVFTRIERVSPGIVALAEQESWRTLGAKYASLYRGLVQG